MELNEENEKSKSSFLFKLREMLNETENKEYIKWDYSGKFFIIYCKNKNTFADNILSKYFNHNNYDTFHRQLNKYNFHTKANSKKDEIHFVHDKFYKGINDQEIKEIKPKKNKLIRIKNKNKKLKKVNSDKVREEENGFENIENLDEHTKKQKIEEIITNLNNPNKIIFNFLLDETKKTNEKLKIQDNLINNLNSQINNYEEQLKILNNKLNNTLNNTNYNNNNLMQPKSDSINIGSCFDPTIGHLNENSDSKNQFFMLNGGTNSSTSSKYYNFKIIE